MSDFGLDIMNCLQVTGNDIFIRCLFLLPKHDLQVSRAGVAALLQVDTGSLEFVLVTLWFPP